MELEAICSHKFVMGMRLSIIIDQRFRATFRSVRGQSHILIQKENSRTRHMTRRNLTFLMTQLVKGSPTKLVAKQLIPTV
jgi:hypothetical protein